MKSVFMTYREYALRTRLFKGMARAMLVGFTVMLLTAFIVPVIAAELPPKPVPSWFQISTFLAIVAIVALVISRSKHPSEVPGNDPYAWQDGPAADLTLASASACHDAGWTGPAFDTAADAIRAKHPQCANHKAPCKADCPCAFEAEASLPVIPQPAPEARTVLPPPTRPAPPMPTVKPPYKGAERRSRATDLGVSELGTGEKAGYGDTNKDDLGVFFFSHAMREKLAVCREQKGRHGWYDPDLCSTEHLELLLRVAMRKGDVVDIANYCMMLHQRGVQQLRF